MKKVKLITQKNSPLARVKKPSGQKHLYFTAQETDFINTPQNSKTNDSAPK